MPSNRVITDKKRRKLALKYEHKRKEYKSIAYDRNLPNAIRYEYIAKLSKLPRNSSMTRSRNRCVVTVELDLFIVFFTCLESFYASLLLKGVYWV